MQNHWKLLLDTNIACDLIVCNDLDTRSFEQGQDHWQENWQEKCTICVRSIYLFLKKHWKLLPYTKIAYMYDLRVCIDFLPMLFGQVKGL